MQVDTDVVVSTSIASEADPRRWTVLGVLCLSLMIVGIDGTIVNVALPTLVRELHATSSQLQWIVDAYTIVFASLLLFAGNAGDRLGRKGALMLGLVIFGAGSLASAFAGSATVLIATRAIQGLGGAFIMPTTLSILTNVFPEAGERSRAIAIWAGVSGLGVAIGPLAGGFLLEHFWWGSIFLINVPVIILALIAVVLVVPRSKDPDAPKLDLVGTVLVTFGLVAVLFAIIEGPTRGWSEPLIIGAFVVGAVLLTAFTLWELHTDHPILDVTFFANPRFTAASIAITLVFFAMFGVLFFLSQFMQFVLGYSALQTGAALLPLAAVLMIAAPSSAKLVGWFGTKIVVTIGLGLVGFGMLLFSFASVDSGYGLVAAVLVVVGLGMGLAMAPATDSIMGSLPPERAGVGSAVNDTTREIGGALGVAILGSITVASYRSKIESNPQFDTLVQQAPQAAKAVKDSVGGAAQVAALVPDFATAITSAANEAFVQALRPTVIVGAFVAFIGAAVAAVFLPARAAINTPEHEDVSDLVALTAQRLPDGAKPPRDATRAVLGLLADSGLSSLSFNGIATRSGISTATLDRYWGSHVDAVADAMVELFGSGEVPHTGSLRGDCTEHLTSLAAALSADSAAPVISTLLSEGASKPELARELRERILAPRRVELVGMVEVGIDRGDVPPDTDAGATVDLLVAPLFHRALVTGEAITPRFVEQIVDTVLTAPPQLVPA